MGLSFHYSGSIAKPELLNELIEEIQDISNVYHWKYTIYDRQFPEDSIFESDYNDNIYGISFSPLNCETIFISFLSNGRMSSPAHLSFFGKDKVRQESPMLYMLSVKTQYAGVELHQFIIQLFRYLSKKYFADFKLTDEGKYWETNDEAVLKASFKKYTELISSFTSTIESYPIIADETIENYFERLLKHINDKKKEE
jgi:hypothetical protein